MKKFIIIPLILFSIKTTFSQDIMGEWLKVDAININSSFHTNPYNKVLLSYERIKIFRDSVYFYLSPIDFPSKYKYKLDKHTFEFSVKKYQYQLKNDTLFLFDDFTSADINMQPMKYTFVRLESLFSDKLFNDSIIQITIDTLIITNSVSRKTSTSGFYYSLDPFYKRNDKYHFPTPTFIGEYGDFGNSGVFSNFLQDNIVFNSGVFDTINSVFAKASFIIDPNGNISNILVNECTNELFSKRLLKVLRKKTNKWLRNDRYYFKLIFPIKYIKDKFYRDERFYYDFYEDGNRLYLKKKYLSAIEKYSKAIESQPDFVDAYYNRAVIYFELGQIDKACMDWKAIYKLGKNDSYNLIINNCNR